MELRCKIRHVTNYLSLSVVDGLNPIRYENLSDLNLLNPVEFEHYMYISASASHCVHIPVHCIC
jgi:hypothetical protein